MVTLKFAREYLAILSIPFTIKGSKATGYRIYRKGMRNDPWEYEDTDIQGCIDTAEACIRHQRLVVPVKG